jgi:hypothetical protein
MEEPVRSVLAERKFWFVILARGAVSLLFALLAIAHPWGPIARVAKLFSAFALVDGLLALSGATIFERTHQRAAAHGFGRSLGRSRLLTLEGVVGLGSALAAVALPGVTALRIVGAFRGLCVGAGEMTWSHRERSSDLIEVGGSASIGLSVVLLAWPGPGQVALSFLLGLVSLVSGALFVAGSFSELKRLPKIAEATG